MPCIHQVSSSFQSTRTLYNDITYIRKSTTGENFRKLHSTGSTQSINLSSCTWTIIDSNFCWDPQSVRARKSLSGNQSIPPLPRTLRLREFSCFLKVTLVSLRLFLYVVQGHLSSFCLYCLFSILLDEPISLMLELLQPKTVNRPLCRF